MPGRNHIPIGHNLFVSEGKQKKTLHHYMINVAHIGLIGTE